MVAAAEHRAETFHIERYADVRAALVDARLVIHKPLGSSDSGLSSEHAVGPARSRRIAPLSHTLAGHLSGPSVAQIAARVNGLVAELLARGTRRGEMDLVADLAYPLTLTVMQDLLGLPHAETSKLRPLFAAITAGQDIGANEGQRNVGRLAQVSIMRWVSRHLDASPSPLVAAIRPIAEGSTINQAAAYWCTMLLHAGSTTTRDFIANCLARLLEHPEEAEQLRDDPALLGSAIEELLRIEGPVRALGRIAREDTEIGDLHLPRGTVVHLHLDKANRDPAAFAEPDRVDFSRSPNPHLAFGVGITRCLGSHLAKLETGAVLTALLPRLPRMSLTAKPQWGPSTVLRERTGLAVRFR
jgi:cytochrome P450